MSGNTRGGDFGALSMSEKLEVISGQDDAVFIFSPGDVVLEKPRHLYSGDELAFEVTKKIVHSGGKWLDLAGVWFDDGVECRVLSPGTTDWRKGKIHLCFKFVPEEEPVQGEFVRDVIQLPPASTEVMPETSDRPEGE